MGTVILCNFAFFQKNAKRNNMPSKHRGKTGAELKAEGK
tara:strand:+ start:166 stop:282 length:117 start_codon:yes stop_codon:yes gene_type:complete